MKHPNKLEEWTQSAFLGIDFRSLVYEYVKLRILSHDLVVKVSYYIFYFSLLKAIEY